MPSFLASSSARKRRNMLLLNYAGAMVRAPLIGATAQTKEVRSDDAKMHGALTLISGAAWDKQQWSTYFVGTETVPAPLFTAQSPRPVGPGAFSLRCGRARRA